MPAQLTYGTAGATGGGFASYKGLQPLFREERVDTRPDWSWQRRSAKTWKDRNRWVSLWPTARFCGGGAGGGVDAMVPVGQGIEVSGMYEPYSCDGEGTQTLKWILGRCEDASGVAISDAIVKVFRASDDLFCGQTTSLSAGSFMCPSSCVGVNVYITAYKVGAPDVGGRSVNTLTPTNIDGT